jgi:hypothetical protein
MVGHPYTSELKAALWRESDSRGYSPQLLVGRPESGEVLTARCPRSMQQAQIWPDKMGWLPSKDLDLLPTTTIHRNPPGIRIDHVRQNHRLVSVWPPLSSPIKRTRPRSSARGTSQWRHASTM